MFLVVHPTVLRSKSIGILVSAAICTVILLAVLLPRTSKTAKKPNNGESAKTRSSESAEQGDSRAAKSRTMASDSVMDPPADALKAQLGSTVPGSALWEAEASNPEEQTQGGGWISEHGTSGSSPSASLTSEAGGQRVLARIQAGSRVIAGAPNDLGLFPRVPIALEETVQVSVSYPGGAAGDLVTVQAEDGGSINGGPPVAQMRLDEALGLRFAFKSTREGGVYRVTLRNGFDEKRLEFWGGREPVASAASSHP